MKKTFALSLLCLALSGPLDVFATTGPKVYVQTGDEGDSLVYVYSSDATTLVMAYDRNGDSLGVDNIYDKIVDIRIVSKTMRNNMSVCGRLNPKDKECTWVRETYKEDLNFYILRTARKEKELARLEIVQHKNVTFWSRPAD